MNKLFYGLLCGGIGFFTGVYVTSKKINQEIENDNTDLDEYIRVSPEDLKSQDVVESIIAEWGKNHYESGGVLTFHHDKNDKCYLCEKIDAVDLSVDGIVYEHTLKVEQNQTFHILNPVRGN